MFTDTPFIIRAATAMVLLAAVACSETDSDSASPAALSGAQPSAAVTPAQAEGNSVYQLDGLWYNQDGDSLRLASLAGRVQVVAMVYTNCHSTCPLIISDMKRIEASLTDNQRDAVRFVLVSLDPARDTPARLTEWATSIGLNMKYWTLLSGSEDAVRELATTLDVRYQPQQNGELAHSNGLSVLDTRGNVSHRQIGLGETATSIQILKSLLQ